MIGFQHLVTVTNTDTSVRRMLLSALPAQVASSNPSQPTQSAAADTAPFPSAADDEAAALGSPSGDSPAEFQSAMEVSTSS
jgi:hypothetical protein